MWPSTSSMMIQLIICDKSKQDRKGYHGAPDFVVEVLSESTRRYDKTKKLDLYVESGVKEYWIIDPEKRRVHKYVTVPKFDDMTYSFGEDIPVSICEGFSINLSGMGF